MILDIILVIALILVISYGKKKGCVKILASLASIVVALILGYLFAKGVGYYIADNTGWGSKLKTNIQTGITDFVSDAGEQNEVINKLEEKLQIKATATDKFSEKITQYIFTGIGFEIVFVVTRLVIWVASLALNGVFKLPVLKQFNALAGIIASVVLFLVELSIILSIVYFTSSLGIMKTVVETINSSIMAKSIYEHNIINAIILTKII